MCYIVWEIKIIINYFFYKNAVWLTNVNQYATSVKWAVDVYIAMWNIKLLICTKENFEEDNPSIVIYYTYGRINYHLWKESLNSDGQQFHQYQKKEKSYVSPQNSYKATAYDTRNAGPGVGQTQTFVLYTDLCFIICRDPFVLSHVLLGCGELIVRLSVNVTMELHVTDLRDNVHVHQDLKGTGKIGIKVEETWT